MDELVEVGVFADGIGEGGRGEPLYQRWHRVKTGAQRITIVVPAAASLAGLDPRRLLFDFEPDDNMKRMTNDPR